MGSRAVSLDALGSYLKRCWLQDGAFWAILGDVGAYWWQDDVTRTRDEATYAKKTAARRNWEPQEGRDPLDTHASKGGGSHPRSLQTGDSRLRLQLELETPTPAGSPDCDSHCNWICKDWMIGDSDWSLRRGIEHATVPTARWRIYIYIYIY